MNTPKLPKYLYDPLRVKTALANLESSSTKLGFLELFEQFENNLGINNGDQFPIPCNLINTPGFRARVNSKNFLYATNVDQIGVNYSDIKQGRANPNNIPIFYGSNSKSTAAFEVLQDQGQGFYIVTVGNWISNKPITIANLAYKTDADFEKIGFVQCNPTEYIKDWPSEPKLSTNLILEFFKDKFKLPKSPGLYHITNIIASACFSLKGVDGIGYAAVSNKYKGYNIALKDPNEIMCTSVERWLVDKSKDDKFNAQLLQTGTITEDNNIHWEEDKMPFLRFSF